MKSGTFIDIGAGHPVVNSISKAFVNAGWHGINIEPMEKPFAELVTNRPYDINLNIAVEDHEGTATYFSVDGGGEVSTGISDIARGHEARHMEVREQSVTTRTLTNICEEYIDGEIHFLKIDVEGNERKVLEGGFVIIDDYGCYQGCQRAVDEFLAQKNLPHYLNHIDAEGRYLIKR